MEFSKYKETYHLKPLEIPSKDKYLFDLYNIEHSLTGRLDAWIANTFITEASHLIVNSIILFEKGYFDCSYYSLRQSIEVATTMMYLIEADESIRKTELKKWKSEKNFPMYSQMIQYLESNESTFKDIKSNLINFFLETAKTKKRLNKYAHKQGFDKFYSSRNHPISGVEDNEKFLQNYEDCLIKCIGTVAVMRLAIDPMPVLLADEEIYSRTEDTITSPYSEEFMEKYIGAETLECYKKTALYNMHHDFFMENEKQCEAINNIIKDQYVDIDRIDEILEQGYLLGEKELFAVKCCKSSKKITKFYTTGGMMMYFTNRKTKRIKTEWAGKDFSRFGEMSQPFNIEYDEAYISVFSTSGEDIYFEHNGKLSKIEIDVLKDIT